MPRRPCIPGKNRTVIEYPLDSAAAFEKGAPVILDADEEAVEAGADPAAILGFSLHPAKDPVGNARDVLPNKVSVAVALHDTTFWITGSSNPVQDNIGKAFGIAKDGDGIWYLDITDTVNTACRVVAIDTDLNLFEVVVESDTLVLS